jgi:hypothetical protein
MSLPDYEIHISDDRLNSLWDSPEEDESFPFGEDNEEIDRIIAEEIGSPTRRSRRTKRR